MKILRFFQNTISKCYDLIGKNIFLPAPSLYSGPSMKLKLFINHYESSCCIHYFPFFWDSQEIQLFLYPGTIQKQKELLRNFVTAPFCCCSPYTYYVGYKSDTKKQPLLEQGKDSKIKLTVFAEFPAKGVPPPSLLSRKIIHFFQHIFHKK